MSLQSALDEIDCCSGKQFDPEVVEAFYRAYPDPDSLPIDTPKKVHHRLPEGLAAGSAFSSK
jgi:response regulator RpfG family c-di-GMP phosphodiesterase